MGPSNYVVALVVARPLWMLPYVVCCNRMTHQDKPFIEIQRCPIHSSNLC